MYLTHCEVVCAGGEGGALLDGLAAPPAGSLHQRTGILRERAGHFGIVKEPPPLEKGGVGRTTVLLHHVADKLSMAIEALKGRYDADRIGVIIGTTTTGIDLVESASSINDVDYHGCQELAAISRDLADYLGLKGPDTVVSTACTSGARALGLARRLIAGGWLDAAVAGGAECLTRMTCQGFDALESYAANRCRPFQAVRDGINIGEAAALFVVEPAAGDGTAIRLSGYGESSDAFHESAPDPEGRGAESAIRSALADANLQPGDIDYVNLHGTGTSLNDRMEAGVMARLFGPDVPLSATKAVTGHTLGAAGAVEAAILWHLLARGETALPPQHGVENYDPELPALNMVRQGGATVVLRHALSTSFAFGGHNVALVLSRDDGGARAAA